jgi:hypothetical protein
MVTAGALRACWLLGLAVVQPGTAGLVFVIAVQFGLITCVGVFNPVFATYRLDQTATDRIARTLSAWSVTSNAAVAAMTALWGLLASITGPRAAIAIAGLLMLTTPLVLRRVVVSGSTRAGWPRAHRWRGSCGAGEAHRRRSRRVGIRTRARRRRRDPC